MAPCFTIPGGRTSSEDPAISDSVVALCFAISRGRASPTDFAPWRATLYLSACSLAPVRCVLTPWGNFSSRAPGKRWRSYSTQPTNSPQCGTPACRSLCPRPPRFAGVLVTNIPVPRCLHDACPVQQVSNPTSLQLVPGLRVRSCMAQLSRLLVKRLTSPHALSNMTDCMLGKCCKKKHAKFVICKRGVTVTTHSMFVIPAFRTWLSLVSSQMSLER